MSTGIAAQDKRAERGFFSGHAASGAYDVFTPRSTDRLMRRCFDALGLPPGAVVADLGCGSGAFTRLLSAAGHRAIGLDLSEELLAVGRRQHGLLGVAGDVESLPLRSESIDGLLLSGIIHHLPDCRQFAREAFRVLKPGGRFAAFDPNLRNPFMWLYRCRRSPWYSPRGVTPNEQPIVASQAAGVFADAGFEVTTDYMSLSYGYIASSGLRWALPVYNGLERALFAAPPVKSHRAFVITMGVKPCRPHGP